MPLSDEFGPEVQAADAAPTADLDNDDGLEPENAPDQKATTGSQSRIISRVLTPAVKLWVRSQLEHVEDLQITIEAGDRQILSGNIRQVGAAASKAIYRGLYFSQIQVSGQDIQTNLGQMLRGKPFRLLAAFPVRGEVSLSATDLNASLQNPLLANAVIDFLLILMQRDNDTASGSPPRLQDVQVELGEHELTLTGVLVTDGTEQAIAIRTGLRIKGGNLLELRGFQHRSSVQELIPIAECPAKFTIPLGSDVQLDHLSIQSDYLVCQGQIMVRPGNA